MRVLLLSAAVLGFAATASAELPPLIPRETLFGNPERAGPQISPDGKYLSYRKADDKNVMQVWVKTMGKDDDRVVTADPKRGITTYYWAHDGKHLLYQQDADGDENFHLYAVNVATKETRDLTPHKGVRVQGVMLDKHSPNEVLVGMNKRDKAMFDMHRIKLDSGADTLDTENPGMALAYATDAKFRVVGCTVARADGGYDLKVRFSPDAEWKTVKSVTADEQAQLVGFAQDSDFAYVIHNAGANALRLIKMNVRTGKEEVVAEDAEYDVSGAMIDDDKRIPLAVSFTKARTEWKVIDDSVKADFEALAKVRRGDFTVVSQTENNKTWVVSYVADDGPVTWYLYDRDAKKPTYLFNNNSKLETAKLAQTEAVEFTAKDGLTVRGYLTRPVGVESKKQPTILLVHGGPWARDTWGYNPIVQWLANRGYNVLQVNFRGSTGYGKKFLNAGNREWAGKMHQDLLDGIDYFAKQGAIDPKQVGIMGGSYGGYATLVGLTFTPDVFACGVDIVGPSNIATLLKTIPPYWAPAKALFNTRVGNLEKERAFLESRSPLFKADKITKPLLIGQGANDPRVKQAESDQIVKAMRDNKQEVQYVVYPDEGHGFQRPENRMHFFAVTEQFLAKHLGGRAEPMGDIKGASGLQK
jgi:dipeptidyl aminopeptidase/acylaminoacyl peptidase